MRIVDFKECNVIYAENQPEYLPLPAHKSEDGVITSCCRLSFVERIKVLFCGRIYISVMTFNEPLQPIKIFIDKKEMET